MIDMEATVFNSLMEPLRATFPGIYLTGEAVASPSDFPCVSIVEQSNTTYMRTLTQTLFENHADLMYQIDVYSNLATGKKSECKAIFAVIDEQMQNMGFVRTFLNPTPNATDIYRMTGRYTAVASTDLTVYRR